MKSAETKVCIIIPAYNEARVIRSVIKKMSSALKSAGLDAEIVVINDGSRDDTAEEAKNSGATVINHILNSGAGGATSTGLAYALTNKFAIAATMDADGQHIPEDVIKGIRLLADSDTDLLIGSRLIDSEGMSGLKVIGNKGLSYFTYALFGVNVTDSQSGLRIFSQRALEKLQWKTTGYEFCSEMLWRAKQMQLNIDEYPIEAVYTDYSKSKGQNNWNGVNILKSLVKRRVVELFE